MTLAQLEEVKSAAHEILSDKKFDLKVHKKNLGLCDHIVGAITQVLETYSDVIVLEDDICVGMNFYKNMLTGIELSKKISGIAAVSAFSALGTSRFNLLPVSWRSTRYFSCWGWSVSKEVWGKYEMYLQESNFKEMLSISTTWQKLTSHQKRVWSGRFSRVSHFPKSTWDIQFQFMIFRYDLRILAPTLKFSDNQGFNDIRSEHTVGKKPRWIKNSKRFDALIPSKRYIWIEKPYQKIIDENTIAGDSWITAQLRFLRKSLI